MRLINKGSMWAVTTALSLALVAPGCGDDDDDNSGGSKGGSAGKGGSKATGGTSGKGGSPATGGISGSATGGRSGAGSGGTAGKGGSGGTAGKGGTAGIGGEGAEGGEGGNAGGEGGQGGMEPIVLFDFEDGTQGWGGASATQSTEQHFDGANSLKFSYAALDNANTMISVAGASRNGVSFWPGTELTVHAFLPIGWDTSGGTYFQFIGQANNYAVFDSTGNSAKTPMPGAWATWTYTVPETFPGGFQALAFQIGDNALGATIPAGAIYIDAITATPGTGTPGCARATPAGLHDFETAWAALPTEQPYQVADGSDPITGPNVTIARSTAQMFMGSASLAVTFTGLPAPTSTPDTKRIVFVNRPNVYCGQNMTFHVFLPTGSDGLNFQVFAQYDNYSGFSGTGPQTTVTRDAWNTASFTIPTTVGPGGIQRVGIEFIYTGTAAYTGEAYIDQITW